MNGNGNPNGLHDDNRPANFDPQILQALEIIHDPRSTNTLRQNASQYLEIVKSDKEAPYHGFVLASSRSQPAIARHFGLSLLDYAVRHRWVDYTVDQRSAVQEWILELAQNIANDDPFYIRNKIAELWVEIAKRSWALDWMNMDELLVRLWDSSVAHKLLVLTILENLSEDIFGHEDTTAGLRGTDLSRACVDIFTPAIILVEQFPSRETSVNVRYGKEGWLVRTGTLLDWCVSDGQISETQKACAVKGLSVFKSATGWVIPKALVTTRAVQRVCACLSSSSLPIQLVSMFSLNYTKNHGLITFTSRLL